MVGDQQIDEWNCQAEAGDHAKEIQKQTHTSGVRLLRGFCLDGGQHKRRGLHQTTGESKSGHEPEEDERWMDVMYTRGAAEQDEEHNYSPEGGDPTTNPRGKIHDQSGVFGVDRGDDLSENLKKEVESNNSRREEPLVRWLRYEGPALPWERNANIQATIDLRAEEELRDLWKYQIVHENRRE